MNNLNINANNIMVSGNYGFGQGLKTGLRAYGDIMFNNNTILGQLLADINAYNGGNANVSGNTVDPRSNQRSYSSPASFFHGGFSPNYLMQGFRPQMPQFQGDYQRPQFSQYPPMPQYQAQYPPMPQYQAPVQYQAPIYIPRQQYAMPGQSTVANVAGPGAFASAIAGIR
jgi:hypothetical protein